MARSSLVWYSTFLFLSDVRIYLTLVIQHKQMSQTPMVIIPYSPKPLLIINQYLERGIGACSVISLGRRYHISDLEDMLP